MELVVATRVGGRGVVVAGVASVGLRLCWLGS